MADRIQPGSYFQYSPSGGGGGGHRHASPHRLPSSPSLDRETNSRYLAELLAERQKLGPFLQVLPLCSRLLNQEIVRASGLSLNQAFLDYESPLRSTVQNLNSGLMDLEGWPIMHPEENGFLQRNGVFQSPPIGWHGSPGVTSNRIVKRVIRLDIPVDKFPMFNFVGRLLGPRGNSLKRVEATTGCRVYIRGRGSVKDTIQEDKLRDKPGYEHLNDPLHVLVEAEFPIDVIDSHLNQAVAILEDLLKPMDESMDFYKKEQLRELALLNGTLREESPSMSPSMSPFNSTAGMKRAKTGL